MYFLCVWHCYPGLPFKLFDWQTIIIGLTNWGWDRFETHTGSVISYDVIWSIWVHISYYINYCTWPLTWTGNMYFHVKLFFKFSKLLDNNDRGHNERMEPSVFHKLFNSIWKNYTFSYAGWYGFHIIEMNSKSFEILFPIK